VAKTYAYKVQATNISSQLAAKSRADVAAVYSIGFQRFLIKEKLKSLLKIAAFWNAKCSLVVRHPDDDHSPNNGFSKFR
jgi:hypothetical protein